MTDEPRSHWDSPAGPESVLSEEAVWEGKIRSPGPLRVEGIAHGELEISGRVTIAAHARVDGTVRARTIVLEGDLQGKVQCDDRLELLTGSSVGGDIETGTLVVQEGAFIEATSFKMVKGRPAGRRAANQSGPAARLR
jgi:cytoskeletal protein CcmA (bactofilin family)